MGSFVSSRSKSDAANSSLYSPHTSTTFASSSTIAGGTVYYASDGTLIPGTCIDGILNLEHRTLTNETFVKINTIPLLTKQVISLSLAHNRLTAFGLDEGVVERGEGGGSGGKEKGGEGTMAIQGTATSSSQADTQSTNNSRNIVIVQEVKSSNTSHSGDMDDDDDNTSSASFHRTSSMLAGTNSSSSSSASITIKPLPSLNTVLKSSHAWPLLENLDLSGNNELFSYTGLASINFTLRSLRLSNNSLIKVPLEVWCLVNLMKLDLSANRLLVLPAQISYLTKLNSLKLSHNSLASSYTVGTTTTSCIPEELKFCVRLRRLDLSHNKLRELPVNLRVDKENARRSMNQQQQQASSSSNNNNNALLSPRMQPISSITASTSPLASPRQHGRHSLTANSTSAALNNNNVTITTTSSSATAGGGGGGLRNGGGFHKKKLSDENAPILTSLSKSIHNNRSRHDENTTSTTASIISSSAAPPAIKYFDPNRLAFVQITFLNLSNNQIDSLTPSIGLLRSLNSLNLGYNKLRSLPTEIALLTELKLLDLRFNQLPSLLTEICQLPRLSKLCLQNNKLVELPYEIRRLSKLTHFFLSSNQLVDLPDVLYEISHLRVLKLCNNRLLNIPDSIFSLQKLRLLDLSFNKLTFLSPSVCNMPLIEDLRLWGNKISDIPTPILYSDVKKIITYLRATERERCLIANQMRSLQGPRSNGRGINGKSSVTTGSSAVGRSRAQSATTRGLDRFSPVGFYDGDEAAEAQSARSTPGIGGTSHFPVGRSASSTSLNNQPLTGKQKFDRSNTGGFGLTSSGHSSNIITGVPQPHGYPLSNSKSDSESDADDGAGSDDEFTSMFRATSSRSGSFHAGGAGMTNGTNGIDGLRNRNTPTTSSPAYAAKLGLAGGVNRDRAGSAGAAGDGTTIVQPFSGPSNLISGNGTAGIGASVGVHHPMLSGGNAFTRTNSSSVGGISGAAGSGSNTRRTATLHSIHDNGDADEDEDAVDVDPEMQTTQHPNDSTRSTDVLNDLVRRDWKPSPSNHSNIHPSHSSSSSASSSPQPGHHSTIATDKATLMAEWDLQSEAIEKQQTTNGRKFTQQRAVR